MTTSRFASASHRLRRLLVEPSVPLVGLEVRRGSLGLARLKRAGGQLALESAAVQELPEGCLVTSMEEPGIRERDVFLATLRSLLERAGLGVRARAALILPDSVVRVRLVPRSELEGSGEDLEHLLRFRLRSTLPFDVRDAGLAWADGAEGQVVAAAVGARVRADYESACGEAGLDTGLLLPASLALAEAPELAAPGDHLIVNRDDDYVSFLLMRDGEVLFYRSLAAEALAGADRVRREAGTTHLYYRERLGGTGIASLRLRACGASFREVAEAIEGPLGLRAEPMMAWAPSAGAPGEDRLEALSGALACLRGRAA